MITAEATLTARFHDLDPMGVVWHGHYPRYLDAGRDALLDKIGYNYREMADSGYVWPIVDLRVKYVRPITLAQRLIVAAALAEYENRLCVDYRIRAEADGTVLTKARTVQLAVRADSGELCLESPAVLVERVRRLL